MTGNPEIGRKWGYFRPATQNPANDRFVPVAPLLRVVHERDFDSRPIWIAPRVANGPSIVVQLERAVSEDIAIALCHNEKNVISTVGCAAYVVPSGGEVRALPSRFHRAVRRYGSPTGMPERPGALSVCLSSWHFASAAYC